ncbi:hypothetical protein TNCV_534711 [Trichonephila clavipes]|nr:hypothetical protein TNCV_534711 [Trichonephila clavipes]
MPIPLGYRGHVAISEQPLLAKKSTTLFPGTFTWEGIPCKSGTPEKVDVSIFCYGFVLIDYSNAHEVIHTSPVLQVLNGATAICEDPSDAIVSSVEVSSTKFYLN